MFGGKYIAYISKMDSLDQLSSEIFRPIILSKPESAQKSGEHRIVLTG